MDEEQLRKRIEWLDELRRKDAGTITRLTERVAKLETLLENQGKHLQQQMADLARLSGQVGRIDQFEETMERQRAEMAQMLEAFEKRQAQRLQHSAEQLQRERGELGKAIDELREQMAPLAELESQMMGRMEEELRLNRAVEDLAARLQDTLDKTDGMEQRILALTERVASAERRLAEAQAQGEEARTRIEQALGRVDVAEDRLRRVDQLVGGMRDKLEAQEEALLAWQEKTELRMVEFERAWKDWLARMEGIQQVADQLEERMVSFDQSQRALKQLNADLEATLERLERRIREVTEMHRLNEERFQREWSAFQADDQRRWSGYRLESEEAWRAHERIHQRLEDVLTTMQETLAEATQAIDLQSEQMQKRVMDLLNMVREWGDEIQLLSRQSGA